MTWPLERLADMDPRRLRQTFGRDLRLGGGIGKEALIAGREAIDRSIEQILPMIRDGGYVPAVDDCVPPEVSFETYKYFVQAMQQATL